MVILFEPDDALMIGGEKSYNSRAIVPLNFETTAAMTCNVEQIANPLSDSNGKCV